MPAARMTDRMEQSGYFSGVMGTKLNQRTDREGRTRNLELPSSYGCHLWNQLAQFGRCWTKPEQWMSAISYVTDCLDPDNPGNHESGCDRCYDHWNRFLKALPPSKVTNAVEAGVWVHFIHNQVSRMATPPKQPMNYNQAAQLPGYGWALLSDSEYFEILERFGLRVVRSDPRNKAKAVTTSVPPKKEPDQRNDR